MYFDASMDDFEGTCSARILNGFPLDEDFQTEAEGDAEGESDDGKKPTQKRIAQLRAEYIDEFADELDYRLNSVHSVHLGMVVATTSPNQAITAKMLKARGFVQKAQYQGQEGVITLLVRVDKPVAAKPKTKKSTKKSKRR